jgi:hypothetical protein
MVPIGAEFVSLQVVAQRKAGFVARLFAFAGGRPTPKIPATARKCAY